MSRPDQARQALVWIGIVLFLGLGLWFGWKQLITAKPAEAPPGGGGGRPPATVIVHPVEEAPMVESVPVTGTLRAVSRAEVASQEAAAVESILVEEGQLIEKGKPLARLDARRLKAQSEEAEATLVASMAELEQRKAESERAQKDEMMMRGLWEEKAVAERAYLDSLSAKKVAVARQDAAGEAIMAAQKRRDLLKLRLDDLEIIAPFTGRVVARHVERGEWLREGDPVVTLVSTGTIEAWLQLPERHVALLSESLPEAVSLRLPGRTQPLSVAAENISIVPDVEGRSRRFTMIARIEDPGGVLTPGLSVDGKVPLGKAQPRLVVRSDAVLQSYAGSYVYVAAPQERGPDLATRVPVDVLFVQGGRSVLASGQLEAGDEVIVEGNERLFPGTPVAPVPWSETRGEKPGSKPATSPNKP